jgi:hypothetical protein
MPEPLRLVPLRPPAPKRKGPVDFSVPRALELADRILAGPPSGHNPRVPGRGVLLARFVMPLELASPENRHSRAANWMHAARKERLFRLMWVQAASNLPKTPLGYLPHRPMARLVRFSSVETDDRDGFKAAIDFLCVPVAPCAKWKHGKKGLGFLTDDAPKYLDRSASWWERAPRGQGLALVELWSGGPS